MSHSVGQRLRTSLVLTILRSGVAFVTGLLIARALGPGPFGTMVFLTGTATAYRQLSDLGTSTAFFTFHSQRERSRRFNNTYLWWLFAQFGVAIVAVLWLLPDRLAEQLWRSEPRTLVGLAFLAVFSQMVLWATFSQMAEAKRLTQRAQVTAGFAVLAHLVVVAVAWQTGRISIELVLVATAIEWSVATLWLSKWLRYPAAAPGEDAPGGLLREFANFCAPLVPYAAIGSLYEFADRWLLQTYGGTVHQGYYAAALQFGAIGALANAAVTNIFWKEVAEAYFQGDIAAVGRLHRQISRGLFFVAAGISGFLMPWSAELVAVTLGPEYRDGVTTFAIMLLYPVYQALGQVNGTTAFATQSLPIYAAIGSIGMVLGVAVTYVALAPASALIPGFGLASVGLALRWSESKPSWST